MTRTCRDRSRLGGPERPQYPPSRGVWQAPRAGQLRLRIRRAEARNAGARRTDRTDSAAPATTRYSVMQQPDLQALWQQAVDHFRHQRFGEAEMRCAELIRHASDAPMAYAMLAQTCHAA